MNLKKTIKAKLDDTLRMCSACDNARELEKVIKEMQSRLDEPLRVAIVGVMKAGKSTFLNAIMKEKILITGTSETTYTVSWFKYSTKPKLKIIFKNGESEEAVFEDLEKWTARDGKKINPRMDEVKYVEIYYPSEVLKVMELIDTPGLWSTYGTDSNNTMDFLAMGKEADQVTKEEASAADAIIYAFSRGVQQNDAEILQAFQGGNMTANSSPINALGVYTKSDIHWDYTSDDNPFKTAKEVAGNLMDNPIVKNLLYTITPVSSVMVESIPEFDDEDWSILYRLSNLDEQILLVLLSDKSLFMEWDTDRIEREMEEEFSENIKHYMCTTNERRRICSKCGQYAIYEITKAMRGNMTKEQIIDYLYEKSGMKEVGNLICQHFGNRAFVIKLQYIFSKLLSICSHIISNGDEALIDIGKSLREEIYNIQETEQVFRELKVLQNYYNKVLKFKSEDEIIQMLQIIGEFGNNCEARLGAENGTSIKELSDIANKRIEYWNARANDIPNTRYYEEAANVLSRSCDIMNYHLQSLLRNN